MLLLDFLPGFVKIETFRDLYEAMKSWAFNFYASFSCSASSTSYQYYLNPVKVNRFLSHSKFLVFERQRRGRGFLLDSFIPGQEYSLSHMKLCSFVFQHHMILLQKFPVSRKGASKAVMV